MFLEVELRRAQLSGGCRIQVQPIFLSDSWNLKAVYRTLYIIFGSGVAVNFYHTTIWAYFQLFQLKTPAESSSIPTVNQMQKISYFSTSRNDKISMKKL